MTTLLIILGIVLVFGIISMFVNAPVINESEQDEIVNKILNKDTYVVEVPKNLGKLKTACIQEIENGYQCSVNGKVVLSYVDFNNATYFAEYYTNHGYLVNWKIKKRDFSDEFNKTDYK